MVMYKFISILIPITFIVGCATNSTLPTINENREIQNKSSINSKNKIEEFKHQKEVQQSKQELLLNYEQKDKGLYKITTDDIFLMKNYSKFVSYKIIKSNKNGQSDLHLPYYKLLTMTRSGKISTFKPWKIKVQENLSNDFTITGTNSKGISINQNCSSLVECFTII